MGKKRKAKAPRRGAAAKAPPRKAAAKGPRAAAARDSRTVEPAPSRSLALALAAALAAATFLVYLPVLDAGFVNFDDTEYVTENRVVQRGLTADGVAWAFSTFHAGNWHPLTWISHMADRELYGEWAGGHHLTNLLLHIASALVLFALWRRVAGGPWVAALVAGLFALHPVHVESVAWVSERKDALSTLFWMLALAAYLRYAARPTGRRYAAVLLLFVLGLLAKPMLVTLPFVLLLLDAWPLGRLGLGGEAAGTPEGVSRPGVRPRPLGRLVLEKLPLLVLSAVSSAVTVAAQKSGGAIAAFEQLGLGERLANVAVAYARYLRKLLWPADLAVYYPLAGAPSAGLAVFCGLGLAAVTTVVLWRARRSPHLAVGWLWYLGTLVPVIGLVQVGAQAIADRYAYVPSVGLTLLLAGALPALAARFGESREGTAKKALGAAAAVWLGALGVLTWMQASTWKNSNTLFEHALEVTEGNYLVHNNLGATLVEQGRLAQGIEHLEEALRIQPLYAEAENNLGLAYARTDRAKAVEHYRKAIGIDPRHAMAHNNLANVLAQSGRLDEAIELFGSSLRIDDSQVEARANLGNALAMAGRFDEAAARYREALALDPSYANAHANLANALVSTGEVEGARSSYQRALALDPDHVEAHTNLATLLAGEGRMREAAQHLRQAIRLAPELPQAHLFLGIASLQLGDRPTAEEEYRILRRLAPELAAELRRQMAAAAP